MAKNPGVVVWFTGLPCSGKTTLAKALSESLASSGIEVELLDGDLVRSAIGNQDFSEEGRARHLRYIGFTAARLSAHGVWVLASFVSPSREARDFVRNSCGAFFEVHVSTPLEQCEERDVKGHYAAARAGELPGFTGVGGEYESPEKSRI